MNELPFVNGGHSVEWAPEIPIWFSLTFIAATVAVATVASLIKARTDGRSDGDSVRCRSHLQEEQQAADREERQKILKARGRKSMKVRSKSA